MLQRVQKILSNAGYTSRRKAEELIKEGKVTVNGKIITIGDSADPEKDLIRVEGEKIKKEKKIYIMLNKPQDYHSTLVDQFGRRTILNLIPIRERVYPVGRLDVDTRGLLLLTNDGDFANLVSHPSHEIEKTYVAKVDKDFKPEDIKRLNNKIYLFDGVVKLKAKQMDKNTVMLTLHEGRKHIVKRTLFKCGFYVKDLKRVAIGGLKLDVNEGKWRTLSEADRKKIFEK